MSTTKTYDWTVLDIDGVRDLAGRAARKLSDNYPHTIEYDDALQEAYLILARSGGDVRSFAGTDELGLVRHRLDRDLIDLVKTEAGHRSTQVSYERAREGEE